MAQSVAKWVKDDETAWCSSFMNFITQQLDLERSNSLSARSWLNVGIPISASDSLPGDVCILWRSSPTSWKGHVGIYVSEDANYVYLLGGNQSNQVKISPYPKARVLGYRRLSHDKSKEKQAKVLPTYS